MFKRRRWVHGLLGIAIVLAATPVFARQFLQANTCHIPQDETLVGTLFVFCQVLTIDGTLEGNLIGAAMDIALNGRVADGVYMLGGQMDVHGEVGDDLHFSGLVLNIHEDARFLTDVSDLFSLAMSVRLDEGVRLPGSVLGLGYQMLLGGDVGGEVNFWGSAVEIGGTVSQDVVATVGDSLQDNATAQLETLFIFMPVEISLVNPGLRMSEGSQIDGNLRYRAQNPAGIMGRVNGETYHDEVEGQPQIVDLAAANEETLRQEFGNYLSFSLREFITLAVVGALGLMFAPSLTQAPIRNLRRRPLTSLGVGTLTFILSFPVLVISIVLSGLFIFMLSLLQIGNLTLVGLALLLLLNVGGGSLFYFVAIFVARSIVCLAIGRLLIRLIFEDDGSLRFVYFALLVGAALVGLVVSLPVVGWLLNALTLFLGLGAIVNLIQAELRSIRESHYYAPTEPAFGTSPLSSAPPPRIRRGLPLWAGAPPKLPAQTPPTPPRPQHRVGLDNLPEDFVWWDEL